MEIVLKRIRFKFVLFFKVDISCGHQNANTFRHSILSTFVFIVVFWCLYVNPCLLFLFILNGVVGAPTVGCNPNSTSRHPGQKALWCGQKIDPPQKDRSTVRDLRSSLKSFFPETSY